MKLFLFFLVLELLKANSMAQQVSWEEVLFKKNSDIFI